MIREIFEAFRSLWRFASPDAEQRAALKRFTARYLAAMLGMLALGSAFFFMAIGALRGLLLLARTILSPRGFCKNWDFPRFSSTRARRALPAAIGTRFTTSSGGC